MDVPTLESLKKLSRRGRAFPPHLVNVDSAILFFSVAFFGIHDVVYFMDVENVCLVDNDAEKMNIMKTLYPPSWEYKVGDAFEVVSDFVSRGITYELVNCDPWTPVASRVLIDEFESFYKIAGKYFIVRATVNSFFDKYNISPRSDEVASLLSSIHGYDINVVDLIRDNNYDGGSFKIVIKKE